MIVLYILEKCQHTLGGTVLTSRQRKTHVLALSVPSARILYSMLWQKVITQTVAPLKLYFLPYINKTTHLVFRET
jgi:hypothetical protein